MSDTKQLKKVARKRKKAKSPDVRLWCFDEQLTEPEGQALTALRIWTRAQTDEGYRNRFVALDLLRQGLWAYRKKEGGIFALENDLTLQESAALETITQLWVRWEKEGGA